MTEFSSRPILMVEDTDFDYEMTVRGFRHLGLTAPIIRHETITSASSFLDSRVRGSAETPLPGIVILDLQFQDGDGRELLTRMKSDDSLKTIPVVVWSASSDPLTIEQCYREGASSYIRKAADWRESESALRQFVLYWMRTVTLPARR